MLPPPPSSLGRTPLQIALRRILSPPPPFFGLGLAWARPTAETPFPPPSNGKQKWFLGRSVGPPSVGRKKKKKKREEKRDHSLPFQAGGGGMSGRRLPGEMGKGGGENKGGRRLEFRIYVWKGRKNYGGRTRRPFVARYQGRGRTRSKKFLLSRTPFQFRGE